MILFLSLLLQVALLAPVLPVDSYRVGIVGDSQQQPAIFSQLCSNLATERITHFIGLGDHVQNHGQPGEWQTLFVGPAIPIMALPRFGCVGNHDDIQGYTTHFWPIPQHPVSSIYGAAIACYGAVTVGQVRWVVLDTNEDPSIRLSLQAGGAQRLWLVDELRSTAWTGARWRIACWHHPALTEQWEGVCYYPLLSERRDAMVLLSGSGCSIVLNGHAHAYQRGQWLGMPWIISGGGGGYLDTTHCTDLPEITVAQAIHHCLVMDVTPDALAVRAIDAQRREIDRLVIR